LFEGGTGIGASELVDTPDLALVAGEAAVSPRKLPPTCKGFGALPSAPAAAPAEAGSAHAMEHATEHARMVNGRAITRA
jgi:hypothetical protein